MKTMEGTREGRRLGAALLLAIAGCTRVDPPEGEGTSGSTASTESTSAPTGNDASSSDADAGSDDGACPPGLECPDQDPADLARCEQLGAPSCGDAVVQALEECDGGPGCRACQEASEPTPLIALEDDYIDAVASLADGGLVLAVGHRGPVTRYHADGTVMWSLMVEEELIGHLAVDSAGNAYLVGESGASSYEMPWVASWDATGAPRWTSTGPWFGSYVHGAVDATRLVAAGETEQQNSPLPRGLVAQYDHGGTLQWSVKISSIKKVRRIALVGDEVAVLGDALDWRRSLLRLDEQGAILWSIDLANEGAYGAWGVVHDGAGGTWIYGQRDGGPWARRHDADGAVLGDLDCLGATAGSVQQLLVEPRGSLVASILLSEGVLPIDRETPWLAWVDGGTVTAGARLSSETTAYVFDLARWPDGALAVAVRDTNPNASRVMVVEP